MLHRNPLKHVLWRNEHRKAYLKHVHNGVMVLTDCYLEKVLS
jgi:hypothetical protein